MLSMNPLRGRLSCIFPYQTTPQVGTGSKCPYGIIGVLITTHIMKTTGPEM